MFSCKFENSSRSEDSIGSNSQQETDETTIDSVSDNSERLVFENGVYVVDVSSFSNRIGNEFYESTSTEKDATEFSVGDGWYTKGFCLKPPATSTGKFQERDITALSNEKIIVSENLDDLFAYCNSLISLYDGKEVYDTFDSFARTSKMVYGSENNIYILYLNNQYKKEFSIEGINFETDEYLNQGYSGAISNFIGGHGDRFITSVLVGGSFAELYAVDYRKISDQDKGVFQKAFLKRIMQIHGDNTVTLNDDEENLLNNIIASFGYSNTGINLRYNIFSMSKDSLNNNINTFKSIITEYYNSLNNQDNWAVLNYFMEKYPIPVLYSE